MTSVTAQYTSFAIRSLHEVFTNDDLVIFLPDGKTYRRSTLSLLLPPSSTEARLSFLAANALPNRAAKIHRNDCPITEGPFTDPYFCSQDFGTYNLSQLEVNIHNWVKRCFEKVNPNDQEQRFDALYFSFVPGAESHYLELWPNRIFWKNNPPLKQEKVVLSVGQIANKHLLPSKDQRVVFDDQIRNLLLEYLLQHDDDELQATRKDFFQRRKELSLSTSKSVQESRYELDLSNLDLSGLMLSKLNTNGVVVRGTSFTKTVFKDCIFTGSFIDCNLEKALFISCHFAGPSISFFNTNMERATFTSLCTIEEGLTGGILLPQTDRFSEEFKHRGALNTHNFHIETPDKDQTNRDSVDSGYLEGTS